MSKNSLTTWSEEWSDDSHEFGSFEINFDGDVSTTHRLLTTTDFFLHRPAGTFTVTCHRGCTMAEWKTKKKKKSSTSTEECETSTLQTSGETGKDTRVFNAPLTIACSPQEGGAGRRCTHACTAWTRAYSINYILVAVLYFNLTWAYYRVNTSAYITL